MDISSYLNILRRRWVLVVVPAIVAVSAAWITLPEDDSAVASVQTGEYVSTATVIRTPGLNLGSSDSSSSSSLDMNLVRLYTTVGDVPRAAAEELDFEGDPQLLAAQITVSEVSDVGTLGISASGTDAAETEARAMAFADAVVAFFATNRDEVIQERLDDLDQQTTDMARNLRRLQDNLGAANGQDPIVEAQLTSLRGSYSDALGQIRSLRGQLGGSSPLTILQPAVAIPQAADVFTAPNSPPIRLGLAALLGLALGIALALVIERVDSRLRSREQAEDAFGLPVLAEIPGEQSHRWSGARAPSLLTKERPASAGAEAYRALRSSVMLLGLTSASRVGDGPRSDSLDRVSAHGGFDDSQVILITSAQPREGKTTTAANLAVVMAEAGRRVVVLSMDLRNPQLHRLFDLENHTGLSDLIAADREAHLEKILREPAVPGVRVATSGQELAHPGALMVDAGELIKRARELADIVIIDAAPLTVSDPVDLAPYVDTVLVVARMNTTTAGQAQSARRLIDRLNVPALGTVLTNAAAAGHPYYRAPRLTRGNGQRATGTYSDDTHRAHLQQEDDKGIVK